MFSYFNMLCQQSLIKLTRKFPYVWKLRNTHQNDTWIKDEIILETGKYNKGHI